MKMNPFVNAFIPTAKRTGLLLALSGALIAAPMLAQDATPAPDASAAHHEHHADRSNKQLDHMTHALNLTPDQVAQIKAIQDDSRGQMEAARKDTATGPARHDKMMDLRKQEHEKIRAVLTDEQKTKFDAMMEKRNDQHGKKSDATSDMNATTPPPPPPTEPPPPSESAQPAEPAPAQPAEAAPAAETTAPAAETTQPTEPATPPTTPTTPPTDPHLA